MKSWRFLAPYLRRHRWSLVWGVVFVLLANALAPVVPAVIAQAVDLAEQRRVSGNELFFFAVYILILASIAAGFRFLMRRVLIDVSRDVEYELRNDLFGKLEKLDPSFFDGNNTGDLMSRATNDMDLIRMLIGPAVMYATNTIFSVPLTLVWMAVLDWRLTLVSIVPLLGLPPLVKYFGARTHTVSRSQQDSFGNLTTMVQENLAGIRVVKAYRQEEAEELKFLERNDDYIRHSLHLARLQSIFYPSIRLLVGMGYFLLLGYGGYEIANGNMTVGTLIGFFLLFDRIVWPLIAAGWVVNLIQRGMASLDRINQVMQVEPAVKDSPAPAGLPPVDAPLRVEFRNLTFQYPGSMAPQLKDVTLTLEPGATLGIVGPIGSGKTTLIQLLGRFYPVERGMILIGGRDINDWPIAELRRRISFVFQETFLFSDTIGWNIRFGADDDAAQDAVEQAGRRANVHGDIEDFPKKYDTVLGERGVNLSGGQKQRVSIARALLRKAPILVMDDALSAVDTHTEESILRDLGDVMHSHTTFLISHRISTVAMADEIIVLEHGRITQRGRHEDLVTQAGLYGELYRKQLSEDDIEHYDDEPSREVAAP